MPPTQRDRAIAGLAGADGGEDWDAGLAGVDDFSREALGAEIGDGTQAGGGEAVGDAFGVGGLGRADRGDDDLVGGEPERELAGVVLEQDGDL